MPEMDPQFLAEFARWVITLGCMGIALVVIVCVSRDAIRFYLDRRNEEKRMQSVLKNR